MPTNSIINTDAPESYLDLMRAFPLRMIHNESERKAAVVVVPDLIRKGTARDAGETMYLEVLARLIAMFEQNSTSELLAGLEPRDVLLHLLEAKGMSVADLGRLLGSSSAATMLTKGDREPSKAQIGTLSEFFGVSPAVFIEVPDPPKREAKNLRVVGHVRTATVRLSGGGIVEVDDSANAIRGTRTSKKVVQVVGARRTTSRASR